MKSLNLAGSLNTLPDRVVCPFSGLVLLGMVSGLVFLLFLFHLELVPCYMSLLYPDLHSLVPRSGLHMAGESIMLVGVLLQFVFFQVHPIPSI